jgi:glycosyltransferase 2 family protein
MTRVNILRAGISLGFLVGLLWYLDAGAVLSGLGRMDTGWAAAGVALAMAQVGLLAWRWRYTAGRLGLHLPYRTALEEYYLGVFLNQLLPGGVVGDASRAWRHARGMAAMGPAIRAVILERASAQVVMTLVALGSILVLLLRPEGPEPVSVGSGTLMAAGLLLVAVLAGGGLLLRRRRSDPSGSSLRDRVAEEVQTALLAPGALALQLLTAILAVVVYLAIFLAAARAVGVESAVPVLLPLVAPVLMAMLIPVSIAGWGLREGAAAGLWGLVGLPPEEGVLVSMAYGLLVLTSTLPGSWALLRGRRG